MTSCSTHWPRSTTPPGDASASARWTSTAEFVARLRRLAEDKGLGDRVCFTGPLTGDELDRAYAEADVLVLASRAETYGMVVTEALARGLPVIAGEVGGVPEALGHAADGSRPGLLVPPGDPQSSRADVVLLAR